MNRIKANLGTNVREAELDGRPHLVRSVVILVEGVHCGSGGCMFYPAKDIETTAYLWNGMPVPLYHPESNGEPISANSPDIITRSCLGRLFNMHFEGGKLSGEIWLDVAKSEDIAPSVLDAFRDGKEIEVSTGLYSDDDMTPGRWHNEEYIGTVHNIRPDHLALLPGLTGACSLEDGCGVRANQNKEDANKEKAMKLNRTWAARQLVKNFGLKAPDPKLNEMSLDDVSNALRTFVNGLDTPEFINYLEDVFEDSFVYVTCKRDGGMMSGADGGTVPDRLFRRSYTKDLTTEQVSIGDTPTEVRKEENYVPVSQPNGNATNNREKENQSMKTKKELIDNLVANTEAPFEEIDRKTLEGFTDCKLNKLVEKFKEPEKLAPAANAAPPASVVADPPKPEVNSTPKVVTVDEYLKTAPPEIAGVLNRALETENAIKADLIKALVTKQKAFTENDLKAMELPMLRKIAETAKVDEPIANFAGAAGGPIVKDNEYPGMPSIFPEEKKVS